MPPNELRRTLQPLVDEQVELPLEIEMKLVKRRCLECLEQFDQGQAGLGSFMEAWQVWRVDDGADFEPLKPRFAPLVNGCADRETELQQARVNGEVTDEEAKINDACIAHTWKAGADLLDNVSCPLSHASHT